MSDTSPSSPSRAIPRRSTLRDRAAGYFGRGNTTSLTYVPLGNGRCAFVGERRLWIYEENGSRKAITVRLSDKMKDDLIDAMEGFGV